MQVGDIMTRDVKTAKVSDAFAVFTSRVMMSPTCMCSTSWDGRERG